MADIIAFVSDPYANIIATVDDPSGSTVSAAPTSVPVNTIENLLDVDSSTNGIVNGSVLVYRTTTNKWTSTTTLDAQNMEGGEF